MYKLLTSTEQIDLLNQAYSTIEVGANYCDKNSNANGTKWAVLIHKETLETLKKDCPFLTEDWFSTDTVETLPSDWYWHKPNYPIRIVIDKLKLADEKLDKTDFYALASQMMDEFTTDNQLVNETDKVFIYVTHIDTDKQTLLDEAVSRGTITIENLTNL